MRMWTDDGHLSPETLACLTTGEPLPHEGALPAAEHLAGCPLCALRLADAAQQAENAPCPADFTGEVLRRVNTRATVRLQDTLRRGDNRLRGRRQDFFYALRVCTAAAAALLIVFSGGLGASPLPARAPDFSFADRISAGLSSFSQKLVLPQNPIHWEDYHHDSKKK